MYSGEGQTAELSCIIHGETTPQVSISYMTFSFTIAKLISNIFEILFFQPHFQHQSRNGNINNTIKVSWLRDTVPIDPHNEHFSMDNRGTRYTLTVRRVRSQDFGNYSCVADNQLGKNKKNIRLSGEPRAPVIRSNAQSQWRDKYNISWTVDSYAPIEEYKLYYKLLSNNPPIGYGNHLDAHQNSDSYPNNANYVR